MIGKSCVCLSVPRAGTHMIMKLLSMLSLKQHNCYDGKRHNFLRLPLEGAYTFAGHVTPTEPYLSQISQRKAIYIIRDPRDIVVATHFATLKSQPKEFLPIKNKTIDERITCLIAGALKGVLNINYLYRDSLLWRNHPFVYSTTFEKLVGSKQSREQEIKNIAEHLEIPLTEELLKYCVDNLVGSNKLYHTIFRKGIIGDWKNYFKPHHKELFKKVAGQLLIEEGYEKDLKW